MCPTLPHYSFHSESFLFSFKFYVLSWWGMVCKGREWLVETHDVKSTKDQEKVKCGNNNQLARTVSSSIRSCLRTSFIPYRRYSRALHPVSSLVHLLWMLTTTSFCKPNTKTVTVSPKVTQLGRGRTKIQTMSCWFLNHMFFPACVLCGEL